MLRPLPPFRVRPLKKATIRKSPGAAAVLDSTDEVTVSVKGLRRPIRSVRLAPETRLRVLGRGAASPA